MIEEKTPKKTAARSASSGKRTARPAAAATKPAAKPAAKSAARGAAMQSRPAKVAAGKALAEGVVATASKAPTPRVPAPPKPASAVKPAAASSARDAGVLTLRRKDLVERVVKASGAKKKAVREIVEATLKVLGEALAAGEDLALPPFGKAKVNRHKDTGSGEMMMVKLRRNSGGKPKVETAPVALAEVAE